MIASDVYFFEARRESLMKVSITSVSRVWLSLLCLVEITPVVLAADKHPFNTDDYAAMHRAMAVAVSPNGKNILYEVLFDGTSGPVNKHDWHLIDVSGENSRKLDLPEHFEPSGFHEGRKRALWDRAHRATTAARHRSAGGGWPDANSGVAVGNSLGHHFS